MNTRIKKLRKALDLTQQAFADRLGMKQNTIATYEMGRSAPPTPTIVAICREFNVNEEWLRTGEGDMFKPEPKDALDELIAQYRLPREFRPLIDKYLELTPDQQEAVVQYMRKVAAALMRDEYSVAGIPVTALEPWAEQPPAASPPPWDALEETTCFTLPEYRLPMSAGTGQQAGDEWGEPLHLRKRPPRGASYVARISGNSMEPTYHDGARLFIQGSVEVAPGQIGVFFMDGQQWVKELGDGVLLSHNPAYPPRPMTEDIRCQGLVLGVCDESYFG